MLSKLLSNITTQKKVVSGEGSSEGAGKGQVRSSEQVFKSLLQSLQNEGESSKKKEQLMALTGGSSEKESANDSSESKLILGGSFTNVDGEQVNKQKQSNGDILEKLQEEFQNIKAEYIGEQNKGDAKKDNSKSDENEKLKNIKAGSKENNTGKEGKVVDRKEKAKAENASSQKVVTDTSDASKGGNEKNTTTQKVSGEQGAVKAENITADNASNAEQPKGQKADKINADQEEKKAGKAKASPTNEEGKKVVTELKGTKSESDSATSALKNISENTEGSESKNVGKEKKVAPESKKVSKDVDDQKNKNTEKAKTATTNKDIGKTVPRGDKNRELSEPSPKVQKPESNPKSNGVRRPDIAGTPSAKTEAAEQQRKVANPISRQNSSVNMAQKGAEMKNVQTKQQKKSSDEKQKENTSRQVGGGNSTDSRNKFLSRLGISGSQAQKQVKPLDVQNVSGISPGKAEMNFQEQNINWEEQVSESIKSENEKEAKSNGSSSASMRLGQMPVNNVSLRKKILPGLTQSIQKAAQSAKENAGNWQKHTFTLDDGKNIQLSVRESNGVIQVKMGSMNLDLSKFLQQNLQQIREHLRQEFGADVDLQFENQQQGEESSLSENSESSDRKRNYRNSFGDTGGAATEVENIRSKTVRNFGYNQMEWTA